MSPIKPSQKKEQLVEELSTLLEKLDVTRLYGFPRQKDNQEWLAYVASILKNLDESDYQEFVRLAKTINPTENRNKRRSAAYEISSFLTRKVAEWKRHDFSYLDNVSDEGQKTKVVGNQFKSTPSERASFGNIQISGGTVVFGGGAKITQVAVKELVNALSEEIKEKVPDSKEKNNVLKTLKNITTNETFASVTGTVIGEILRRVTRP